MTVHGPAKGRSTPGRTTIAAVMRVSEADIERRRLDANGTALRLRALVAMGHSSQRIARATGLHGETVRRLVNGDATTVSPEVRATANALYDAWWSKTAPERTPEEKAAAEASRKRAERNGWCTGAALDDDQLDQPGYKPTAHWRRARGTGVALDIEAAS